jgi:Glyoxalase/Bleomycin resistance protein/Dioxygenase superfamily
MSPLETPKSAPVAFHGVTPVLRVNDLAASLDYYVRVLGFKMD